MSWSLELQDRKTGKVLKLNHPFYKRGSNVRAAIGQDGKLYPAREEDADLIVTYNYCSYYYEAAEGDDRFAVGEESNAGLRALDGKDAFESCCMLCDMIQRIQSKYQDEHGRWLETERVKDVYLAENGHVIEDTKAVLNREYAKKATVTYRLSEGDISDYWESTAANAIAALNQLLHMAVDGLTKDAVWKVS